LELTRKDFEARREISLGIYEGETFVGEAVFHNFTYDHMVELGVRLLPEAEGKGYATEAMRCMAEYALCFWGLERVTAKCFKDNLASKKMLQSAGLRQTSEDEQFYYFSRTAKH
jgi:RimJ/RimL family protein N-acetyltransferase